MTPARPKPAPTTHVAFLRSVNVGGRVAKMAEVRELFEGLGLSGVRSYIQSGNVFFDADPAEVDRLELAASIEAALGERFGFDVPVVLVTVDEVEEALALAPFADVDVTDDTRLNFVFISSPLPSDVEFPVTSAKGDFEVLGATPIAAFVVMQILNGRPGNPSAFIEKTFGGYATARAAHTTEKILGAARRN